MEGKPVSVTIYKPKITVNFQGENSMPEGNYNLFQFIADQCGLSVRTIRDAASRKPITWQTACRINRHTGCPYSAFRIKEDRRGRKPKQ